MLNEESYILIKFTEYLVDNKIIFDEIEANEILPYIFKFLEINPQTNGFILDYYFMSNCKFYNDGICSVVNDYPYDCRYCNDYEKS